MTDRMSNVEIEDVLSSIRRLVSDELRPMAPLRPSAPRLMLTPALRVDSPVAVPAPAGADSDSPDLKAPPALLTAVDAAEEESPDLALRLAELEVLLDAQDQPFEAEADEDFGQVSATVWQLAGAEAGQAVPEAPFVSDEEPVGLAELPQGPQPDWQAVLGAAQASDRAAATAPPATEEVSLDLDADMLRALIRDVLREELQGNMGERVTRNLRKMVRSELARALAARGLA